MTFALLWRRDGAAPASDALEALGRGLTGVGSGALAVWARGPLVVLGLAAHPFLSVAEHPSGLVAVVVGRLDDLPATRARLGGEAKLGPAPTDAAVLAAAYERSGEGCLDRLTGEFAAVLWRPAERTLVAARDRLGVVPLYAWQDEREVVLGGHLGAVVAHRAVLTDPDETYLAQVLADAIASRERTLYRDVRRIPAGHLERYTERGHTRVRWSRPFEIARRPVRRPAAEVEEAYRDVLGSAVGDRLRVGTVATELSGGLDSGTVALLAAPLVTARSGARLRSYSLAFPDLPGSDESPEIRAVAAAAGLEATLLPCAPSRVGGWAEEVHRTRDLPLLPNAAPWVALRRAARADGVTCLLTGQGGDQRFDVDETYPLELFLRGRLRPALAAGHLLWPGPGTRSLLVHRLARPAAGLAVRAALPGFRPPAAPAWLTPDLLRRSGLADHLTPTTAPARSARDHRLRGLDSGWEAHVHDVAGLVDACSGLRSTSPFHDARVVQFALDLPESEHWAGGTLRSLQRRAVAGRMPDSVRLKSVKADFGALALRLLAEPEVQGRLANLRLAHAGMVRGDLVREAALDVRARLAAGRPAPALWPVMLTIALDYWLDSLGGSLIR